jgi:hypothetical protein
MDLRNIKMIKIKFKLVFFSFLVFNNCSIKKEWNIYGGYYNGRQVQLQFENSNEGVLMIDNRDTIPFQYKIEKYKFDKTLYPINFNISNKKKIIFYAYRFSINADYKKKLFFPLGFYEIGKKKGMKLYLNDSTFFVKQ